MNVFYLGQSSIANLRQYLLSGLLLVILPACGERSAGPAELEAGTTAITQHLPSGWTVESSVDGQVPEGHYWGDWGRNYDGPRGRLIVLAGPKSVELSWRDKAAMLHREPIAKESLNVWLMPAEYSEGFWSRINPQAPVRPPMVYSGSALKVYVTPSHQIVDEQRFKTILSSANEVDWPDSPARSGTVTWSTWRADMHSLMVASGSSRR